MFKRLSDNELTEAIGDVVRCFGVREKVPLLDMIALLKKRDAQGCVQMLANRLGLPVQINLAYVPKDFRAGGSSGFQSSALACTDWTGRGDQGIIAQVSIPSRLPMFGTAGLQGFPIQVRISESCHDSPYTFVAVMAHELSHILLASLGSPHKDSELHTDLVPIVLGFRDVIGKGRKTTESRADGGTITTTTYGYLTDSQFDLVCNQVTAILSRCRRGRERLLEETEEVRGKTGRAVRSLTAFREYFEYLDRRPPKRMKKEHADRMVQLHGRDYSHYSCDWESQIAAARKNAENAKAFARRLSHYTASAMEQLASHTLMVKLAVAELNAVAEAIGKDERMLRKYVDLTYRFRRILRRLWRKSRRPP